MGEKEKIAFDCKSRNNLIYPNCSFFWILLCLTLPHLQALLCALQQSSSPGPRHCVSHRSWAASPHEHWDCSWKIVLGLWGFFSQTSLLGKSSRPVPARAGISWHGFCTWCHHSQTCQPRSLPVSRAGPGGAGRGQWPPRPYAHRGSCTWPVLLAALLLSVLCCSYESALGGPCVASTTFLLPEPFWSPARRKLGRCSVPAAYPFSLPWALDMLLMKQHCCGRPCSWKELPFLVAQWHSFQELFVWSPLCLTNQWTAVRFQCALPAPVLLAMLATLLVGCAVNMTGFVARLGKCPLRGIVGHCWLFCFISLN